MKTRHIGNCGRHLLGFLPVLTLFIALSCDQPQMTVEPEENDNQILLISQKVDTSWIDTAHVYSKTVNNPQPDSSLVISYRRYEDYSVRDLLIESFNISLVHKMDGDTTLDYGTMSFAGRTLRRGINYVLPAGMRYSFMVMRVDEILDTTGVLWSNDFGLEERQTLISANSDYIYDFNLEIPTQQPNRIMNLDTGQTVSAASNLELVFRREMAKGAVITVGCYESNKYYYFELLQSASKLVIPAEYLRLVKGSLTEAKCQVAYDETLLLGSLVSEDKSTYQNYRVPVFEYTKGSIKVRLID